MTDAATTDPPTDPVWTCVIELAFPVPVVDVASPVVQIRAHVTPVYGNDTKT
jgi:hypothetical protein